MLDWKRVDSGGNNYYLLDFQLRNETLIERPHAVRGYEDPQALKFWLRDASSIERKAQILEKQKGGNHGRHPYPYKNGEKRSSHKQSHGSFWLPIYSNMMIALLPPSSNDSFSPTTDGILRKVGLEDLTGEGNASLNYTEDLFHDPLFEMLGNDGVVTAGKLVGSGLVNGGNYTFSII